MQMETIDALSNDAVVKVASQRRSLFAHIVRSMLAGMYVGAAVVLVLIVAAALPKGVQRLVMGVSFGGALTMVVFAGSELFTGSNLVLTLGVLTGRASFYDLMKNWFWTWIGNFLGSVLFAAIVVRSGVLDTEPITGFVLSIMERKMHLLPQQLFLRAVLANWLVCLAVWMAARTKNDGAKIALIGWCMFTFVACGYEHSVANMTGLTLSLLLPHGAAINVAGYAYNLALATAGNVVGGAGFVAGMVWLGSLSERTRAEKAFTLARKAETAPAKGPQASPT